MPNIDHVLVIHLSDLHLHSVLDRTESGEGDPGRFAHDWRLCEALLAAVQDIVAAPDASPGSTVVVMSGDGSSTGSQAQFRTLRKFLNDLRGNVPLVMVPGNHDHWKGKRNYPQAAYNDAIKPTPFPTTPFENVPMVQSSMKSFRLAIFGVDSNSGYRDKRANRNPTAGGRIHQSEFDGLISQIGEIQECQDVASILVCHHAFSQDGVAPFPLDDSDRNELCRIAGMHSVLAVLTGHQHTFLFDQHYHTNDQTGNAVVTELRAPTATQGPPKDATRPEVRRQGFWTYRIRRVENSLELVPVPYVWIARQRFQAVRLSEVPILERRSAIDSKLPSVLRFPGFFAD